LDKRFTTTRHVVTHIATGLTDHPDMSR